MNNIIFYSFLSILIVVLSHTSAASLEGKWRSTKSSSYLNFSTDGTFQGYDGCNQIWGSYRIINDSLTLSDINGTLIACSGPQVITELPSSGPYFISKDTLIIINDTCSYKYRKQVITSVIEPFQTSKIRTRHTSMPSDVIIFYDIRGQRTGTSPFTGTISRSSGILLQCDKSGYSLRVRLSGK